MNNIHLHVSILKYNFKDSFSSTRVYIYLNLLLTIYLIHTLLDNRVAVWRKSKIFLNQIKMPPKKAADLPAEVHFGRVRNNLRMGIVGIWTNETKL